MENIKTPDGTPLSPPKKIGEDQQAALLTEIAQKASDYRKQVKGAQNASTSLHRAVTHARKVGIPEPTILSAIAK
jgi:hypothetical protein